VLNAQFPMETPPPLKGSRFKKKACDPTAYDVLAYADLHDSLLCCALEVVSFICSPQVSCSLHTCLMICKPSSSVQSGAANQVN
jgi:hypothetical protein